MPNQIISFLETLATSHCSNHNSKLTHTLDLQAPFTTEDSLELRKILANNTMLADKTTIFKISE